MTAAIENSRTPYPPIIDRPPLRWPKGERIAVVVTPNIEHFTMERASTSVYEGTTSLVPDILNYSWRDYGPRVGVWRMMDVLDRYGIRATVALNADVCRHYPRIVEEALKRDWEFMGHGMNNSNRMTGLGEDDERELIENVLITIAKSSGQRPSGWLGPALAETFNTPDLLAEAGVRYVCDWVNDDQPYPMRVRTGSLISMPYSVELNDIQVFIDKGQSGAQFQQSICDHFDVLYREGVTNARVMNIALHPFLIGVPFRSIYLDRALSYIMSHDDVWMATGREVADYYIETYC